MSISSVSKSLLNQILLLVFLLLSIAQAASVAHPQRAYDYGKDNTLSSQKRDASHTPIVGAIDYKGDIPLRSEIRDLQKNHEQWTLYILALDWMQWMSQDDPLSWYAIAGIHGSPFRDYGNAKAGVGLGDYGYCTHVSNLFPTWHRPYLVLFEQAMYGFVQIIASWYPEDRREVFQVAARNWRIPYWDWAVKPPAGESVLPLILGSPRVFVDGPNGNQSIENPLYEYTFKPLNSSDFEIFPFMYWNETKRRPVPEQAINATSNNSWVAETLDNRLPSLQQRLYNLFSNYGNYTLWSNEAWIAVDNDNATIDSIESLHDQIHLTVGGYWGHMAIIAYSSFDPLFFLHHANMDRIFAMWQLIHNDSYVEPLEALLATRTIHEGDMQDGKTDLTPFLYNQTTFWNSDQVRDHKRFGYSYVDVVHGNRSELIANINHLYTDFSPATMYTLGHRIAESTTETRDLAWSGISGVKALVWDKHSSTPPSAERILNGNQYQEWLINIYANKHSMKQSFEVYFFMNDIHGDTPLSWEVASNLVGSYGVFSGSNHHMDMNEVRVSGTVPLTSALMRLVSSGDLPSLAPEDVEPYLIQSLNFRIGLMNNTAVDADQVVGLVIDVTSSPVKAPEHPGELVSWSPVTSRLRIH